VQSVDLPWTDPAHQSALEVLAGQIATHIAGRPVGVRCEGDAEWSALVHEQGGDPSAEYGYVDTTWNSATGQLVGAASYAELAASVCLRLDNFAMATIKPTKCQAARAELGATVAKSVLRRVGLERLGRRGAYSGPCYLGAGKTAAVMPALWWAGYAGYARAVLTLAHESVHLGGVVGGQLANGMPVGDQQAEAKANCYGMQWMQYVAVRLGDTSDDAQAIATYFWDKLYPQAKSSAYGQYWSAECRPGGALDIRPAGSTVWP